MADEALTIRPHAEQWRGLLGHDTSPAAGRFRAELGLPTDRPVIMTGHQTQFWHPGILAKYLAADAFAASTGAAVAFLVVDQDRPDRVSVRYPVVEREGNLGVREVVYGADDRAAPGRRVDDGLGVAGFVQDGLNRIDEAMRAHDGDPMLARRVALAVRNLMSPYLGPAGRAAPILFATELSRTTLFQELVQRMAREPEACTAAYNTAVAAHPGAGIRPLEANPTQDRWELPLWRLLPDGRRTHIHAEDLAGIPPEELAPKALFMTALLRLAGCDLFIHGTGGAGDEGYDRITEDWLRGWPNQERAALAPIAMVTATRYLPIAHGPEVTAADAERAVWRAHHARHVPAELRLLALEQQRRTLVAEIAVAAPPVRATLFRDLHRLLDHYRADHAGELKALARETAAARARAHDGKVLRDRTWAFPLYPALRGLRREIEGAFQGRS
jgi:hypothetical protein